MRGTMRTLWVMFAAGILGCSGDIGDPDIGPDSGIGRGIDADVSPDASTDAPPAQAACNPTDGDTSYRDPLSGHCYFWVNEPVTRLQAMAQCRALGAELASITSAAENEAVANVAPDALPDPDLNSSIDSWIGLNDLAVEMAFVWDNGDPFGFDAWRDGEPNNNNENDPDGEDCAVFEGDSNQWDDRSCTITPHRYICEREP